MMNPWVSEIHEYKTVTEHLAETEPREEQSFSWQVEEQDDCGAALREAIAEFLGEKPGH